MAKKMSFTVKAKKPSFSVAPRKTSFKVKARTLNKPTPPSKYPAKSRRNFA